MISNIKPCDECPGETWSRPLLLSKRKRAETEDEYKPGLDALPFSVSADKAAWTDLGEGLKMRDHDAAWLTTTTGLPHLGLRMCGGYDNRATIVAPSSRVLGALGDGPMVVYS